MLLWTLPLDYLLRLDLKTGRIRFNRLALRMVIDKVAQVVFCPLFFNHFQRVARWSLKRVLLLKIVDMPGFVAA
jgi:hypothetical protein